MGAGRRKEYFKVVVTLDGGRNTSFTRSRECRIDLMELKMFCHKAFERVKDPSCRAVVTRGVLRGEVEHRIPYRITCYVGVDEEVFIRNICSLAIQMNNHFLGVLKISEKC